MKFRDVKVGQMFRHLSGLYKRLPVQPMFKVNSLLFNERMTPAGQTYFYPDAEVERLQEVEF